ncbi:MAG: DUF4264 family protein [Firmicutes bacterium]|nr:DUF4264 family protein [Bacillota bacterium]
MSGAKEFQSLLATLKVTDKQDAYRIVDFLNRTLKDRN